MTRNQMTLALGALGLLAVVTVASSGRATQPADDATTLALKDLEDKYHDLDRRDIGVREQVSKLSRRHDWLERNLYRPGMILPYDGPLSEAVALEKEGWFVCDGRMITDPMAVTRFRGKATPTLQDRFLKGSKESGQLTGKSSVTTSEDGIHSHLLPAHWYHRDLSDGNRNGIDTGDQTINNGNPRVQDDGQHHHTVVMDPQSYTVIYVMYVREVTAQP